MIAKAELIDWLMTLGPEDRVYIYEGGLTLCSGNEDAYLEVGGIGEDPEDIKNLN